MLCHSYDWETEESELHQLYEIGWELMESGVAGCGYGDYAHIWLVLRRLK